MKTLYLGGAIDYADGERHAWRHMLAGRVRPMGWEVYCPVCGPDGAGTRSDRAILLDNEVALYEADRAAFLLDGAFTIGTPIEIAARLEQCGPSGLCIVHPSTKEGLYVRLWRDLGVAVFRDVLEVVPWLTD